MPGFRPLFGVLRGKRVRISAHVAFALAEFRIRVAGARKRRGQTPQTGTDSGSAAGREMLGEAVARLRDGRWLVVVVALAILAGAIAIAGRIATVTVDSAFAFLRIFSVTGSGTSVGR